VVDNVDPAGQNRLLVTVPEVRGDPAWAKPSEAAVSVQLPGAGDEVTVMFEGGDSDYPVWQHPTATAPGPSAGRYQGVYRASVLDNVDPMEGKRLQVSVPDVPGQDAVWASPSPSLGVDPALPEAGSAVWVQFEGGDTNHPVWTGTA
jgi:uncharacterized protein involved in type VI secretion and phage assembly